MANCSEWHTKLVFMSSKTPMDAVALDRVQRVWQVTHVKVTKIPLEIFEPYYIFKWTMIAGR